MRVAGPSRAHSGQRGNDGKGACGARGHLMLTNARLVSTASADGQQRLSRDIDRRLIRPGVKRLADSTRWRRDGALRGASEIIEARSARNQCVVARSRAPVATDDGRACVNSGAAAAQSYRPSMPTRGWAADLRRRQLRGRPRRPGVAGSSNSGREWVRRRSGLLGRGSRLVLSGHSGRTSFLVLPPSQDKRNKSHLVTIAIFGENSAERRLARQSTARTNGKEARRPLWCSIASSASDVHGGQAPPGDAAIALRSAPTFGLVSSFVFNVFRV